MRTRTAPGRPTIDEEGSCDSARVRPGETCTERTVPMKVSPLAVVAAIVIVGLAAAPVVEVLDNSWPPE